ncbi:MAG: hypothetical protein ABFS24_09425 [Pseudomonadota bacterium]
MIHSSIFSRLLTISAFFIIHCASAIAAGGNGNPADTSYPAFRYSETAAEPVIEYNLVHDMLAEPDSESLLRIYGNGRVHVHYPAYMKKAGDYELQLGKAELNTLIRSLANDGIIDFDHGAAIERRKQIEAQQLAATGTLYYISDTTETVIEIRLDEYQRGTSVKRIANLEKRFTWKNLEQDARRFPNMTELQRAEEGVQKLHGLLDHPDLGKSNSTESSNLLTH